MILPNPLAELDELKAECKYSEDGGVDDDGNDLGSVDALIDYKNALEDRFPELFRKAAAWDRVSAMLDRNARGESHASAADVCQEGFGLQEALR